MDTSKPPARLTAGQYYKLVREGVPTLAQRPRADLDAIGRAVCRYFSDGGTWVGAIKVVTDVGVTGREAGALIPYAMGRFCVDQLDKLPS